MAVPSPMAENDAWLKGYEAGVAEGRRQVLKFLREQDSEYSGLAQSLFGTDTPPGEPTTQESRKDG